MVGRKIAIEEQEQKADEKVTKEIEEFCNKNDVETLGRITFDKSIVSAMVEGKTIIEFHKGKAKEEILKIWERLKQ